jgi:PAS domain S-box-containing protein
MLMHSIGHSAKRWDLSLNPSEEEVIIGEGEGKFKSFVENSDIGIFSFNKEHGYKEVNSKFCGMIGYDRDELFEYRFPEPFWPEQFYSKTSEEIESYKKNGLLNITTFFCRKNNNYFPVRLCGSVIPEMDKNDCEYVIFLEDISNQKKAEREFKLSQEMLVALINKLESMVKKRTEELQLVMKQKNEFINQLSHDLKNPLTPMINLIPDLQKKESNDENKEIFSILLRNVNYMRDLIINTIELAKLDSLDISFSFEPVNLKQEIESIIHDNCMKKNEKNINVTYQSDKDIWLSVDKIRFNELISNIVENGIKYGRENGSVIISGEKSDDTSIQIKIVDDGIGMTTEQLQHVFKDFYKVNHQNSTYQSSGLGMSICKRIIEKHGGTIQCESPGLGKGTAVILNLPIKPRGLDTEEMNKKVVQTISSLKEIKMIN